MRSAMGMFRKLVPIIDWLPQYNGANIVGDLIAGITVGLTLIPQSIAYANLAGLEPQYGLYSALCGGFIYAAFGTVKDLNIAPTALISLLTYSYTKNLVAPDAAIFLCFAVGVLQMLFGVLKLGFLVNFVSAPVVSGFTSAGAVTIAASQVKSMLGLKFRAETFVEVVYHVFANIRSTKHGDAVLSVISCIILICLREIKVWGTSPASEQSTLPKTSIWFLSVGRNALVVLSAATSAYFLHERKFFTLTNSVPDGLPPFTPPFSSMEDLIAKTTDLGSGIAVIALVAILSNMAIARAFSEGKTLNASHEMSTLGLCNVVGAFCGSYPVNASFSRAALNNASGARTTFGGIYTGVMVILSLTFLTKYFVFIPKAALASVIFCAVIYMVEIRIFKTLWQTSKIDLIPLLVTFLWSLVDSIERGILIGVAIDLLIAVWMSSRPKFEDDFIAKGDINYIKLPLIGNLTYLSGEYYRSRIPKLIVPYLMQMKITTEPMLPRFYVVFECDRLRAIDYSATQSFGALLNDLADNRFHFVPKINIVVVFIALKESLQMKLQSVSEKFILCRDEHALEDTLRANCNSKPLGIYSVSLEELNERVEITSIC